MLDDKDVHTIQEAYTLNICRRIIWAVVDDGSSFFGKKFMQADFGGGMPRYPTSLLEAIARDVRFAMVIHRPLYPAQWEVKQVEPMWGVQRSVWEDWVAAAPQAGEF